MLIAAFRSTRVYNLILALLNVAVLHHHCFYCTHKHYAAHRPHLPPHLNSQIVDVDEEALLYVCQGLAAYDDSAQGLRSDSDISSLGGAGDPGQGQDRGKDRGRDKSADLNAQGNDNAQPRVKIRQDEAVVMEEVAAIDGAAAAAAAAAAASTGPLAATAASLGTLAAAAAAATTTSSLQPTDPDSNIPLTVAAVFSLSSRPSAMKKVRPATAKLPS
jgi:hypothetical protein